jgi:Leucine-rich repeat (LRR) protein
VKKWSLSDFPSSRFATDGFLINNLFFASSFLLRAFIDNVNLQILSMDDNEQFSDLPGNLFHGNLNLIELSIKNNKLFQLDAIQFPLDQLKKLTLADNPFVCNCSLNQIIFSDIVGSRIRNRSK